MSLGYYLIFLGRASQAAIRDLYPGPSASPAPREQPRLTWRPATRLRAAAIAALAAVSLGGCGGSSSTPQATLRSFLAGWTRGDWTAMQRLVATPPAIFTTVNADAFSALGVHTATFTAGRVRESGSRASTRVTERFELPYVGPWSHTTTVTLVQRKGRWLVSWTPATIDPSLRTGDRLATIRDWPARAAIRGAGGAPLTTERPLVTVGVVGSRIKNAHAVTADLIAAGATQADVRQALAQATAHPSYFDPVFQISQARFGQLKAQPGPGNVYAVPGTQFELSRSRTAITPQLAAHLVGTIGAITADQLHQLGSPYDAASQVGQNGLEQAYERRLAGRPRTRIVVVNSGGAATVTLAQFPGTAGQPVTTSIGPAGRRSGTGRRQAQRGDGGGAGLHRPGAGRGQRSRLLCL
jgi:hypothetical protein